jgi:site-specific recombinase XerD
VPDWVKAAVDLWLKSTPITYGRIFRCVTRMGTVWGEGITEKVIWHVVNENASRAGLAKLSPHDCRRTCARLCHSAGGDLEQIQFLSGHVSVETTERYLGCKQRLRSAVNDHIGLEP